VSVAAGQLVRAGDLLIAFDLDSVAERAKSLISPIVVTNEGYKVKLLAPGQAVSAGDPIAEIEGTGEAFSDPAAPGAGERAELVIAAALGIHARPAARIAAAAKTFDARLEVEARRGTANARSPVALMTLALARGDPVTLVARGPDASAALAALAPLIETDFDEPEPAPVAAPAPPMASQSGRILGVSAAPGLAVGPAARFTLAPIEVARQGHGIAEERQAFDQARAAVAARLATRVEGSGGIAFAHLGLLDDSDLVAAAETGIAAGHSAGFAWRAAIEASASALRATGNDLLIERIDDLRDVEHQLLAELSGEGLTASPVPDGAILLADTLLPSQLMALDLGRIGGLATARGGPTSHAAILAASSGVPMLVAAGEVLLDVADGALVILDATGGWIDIVPDQQRIVAAREGVERQRRRRAADVAAAAEECRMADGTRIEIFANLASAEEAGRALVAGAEGCGLLRTEFLFHDRIAAPTEDEQASAYAAVARALGGRPLIVRTLDAGGDKPLSYLALPPEDNPALGLRGVRLSLSRPDLLATQLRAILRAAPEGDIRIMVPMVVDVAELRAVRMALDRVAADLAIDAAPLGVMVETPAAALLAGSLAAEADFLSIGTNDLSQYALAADRGNPATAARIDALHPAVLRLIAAVGEGAAKHGKWFGICGGIASDPLASAILIGLGATELSATPAAIPALKANVRGLRLEACKALAAAALEADTAEAVRILAVRALSPEMKGAA